MSDIFGQAMLDFQSGKQQKDIITYSSVAGKDILPVSYLFRNYAAMPELEQKALSLCSGTVLDIGCGAGSHAMYLQQNGFDVTGLDKSQGAIKTCRLRGLKKSIIGTPESICGMKFDTLLLLMNGIGLAGNMANLNHFLFQLKTLLKPNGQVLLDSSDIIYMYEPGEVTESENYYGEVIFTTEYEGELSDPFNWLYIDYSLLQESARKCNWDCELVMEGEHYDYLARLRAK